MDRGVPTCERQVGPCCQTLEDRSFYKAFQMNTVFDKQHKNTAGLALIAKLREAVKNAHFTLMLCKNCFKMYFSCLYCVCICLFLKLLPQELSYLFLPNPRKQMSRAPWLRTKYLCLMMQLIFLIYLKSGKNIKVNYESFITIEKLSHTHEFCSIANQWND